MERSPIVLTPWSWSTFTVFGPTPGIFPTKGAKERQRVIGPYHSQAVGFDSSAAILAKYLQYETPAVTVSRLSLDPYECARLSPARVGRNVQITLVDRHALYPRVYRSQT